MLRCFSCTVLAVCIVGGIGCGSRPGPSGKAIKTVVHELIAAKDIPAGTIIDSKEEQFYWGTAHDVGKQPADIFPVNWQVLANGKKIARDLKKGEVIKLGDIVQLDGNPFIGPPIDAGPEAK